MKKRTRSARKKAGKPSRKPIMRHSREGVKRNKAKRSAKPKGAAKTRSRARKATGKAKPAASSAKAKAPVKRKSSATVVRSGDRESFAAKWSQPPFAERAPRREDPGMGAESAGQSGDIEGLSRTEEADSESVEELLEEGQAFEAGVISGVENAPDADQGEVRTRQVPEDDVPQEYLDKD
jgi:hypothetical protein